MSMPQIPEERFRPSLKETLIDLMKSIAMEETALSHVINAEGERLQSINKEIRINNNCCIKCYYRHQRDINNMLDTILMKEWLLLKKLQTVCNINDKTEVLEKDNNSRRCCCHFCQCSANNNKEQNNC
jgi:hypothetical protein